MAFLDPQTLDSSFTLVPPPLAKGESKALSTGSREVLAPVSLPRTGLDLNAGAFRSADSSHELVISHQYAKRIRHTARVNYQTLASDPLNPTANALYTMSAYVVIDVPTYGITIADQQAVGWELANWLYTTDAGNPAYHLERLVSGES